MTKGVARISPIDVLDRVLDKGIVIDARANVMLMGLTLMTLDARVVVASIETYLEYGEAVAMTPAVARPVTTKAKESVITIRVRRRTRARGPQAAAS